MSRWAAARDLTAILSRLPPAGVGEPPSSSGLGHRPFKAEARVRIPLGARRLGAAALAPAQPNTRP